MSRSIYKNNGLFQKLDLSALKHFHSVVVYGGFSKAARATGVSQPALSLGLKKLEKALGVTLIDRSSRQFSLTREGLTLLGFCQRLENSLDSMVSDMGITRKERPKRYRIGTALSIGVGPMIQACSKIVHGGSPPEIEFTSQNTYSLLADLLAAKFDAVLVPDDVSESGLTFTRIKEDRIAFVVAKSIAHEFAKRGWMNAAESIPIVAYPRETPMRALVDRLCLQHDVRFKTIVSANNLDAIKAMTLAGIGGVFVLKSLIREELASGLLVETNTPFSLPKSGIALATREGEEGDAIAKALRTWIRI